jgi:protein required for attachment to host cells
MKQPRTWILVADGARARILRDVIHDVEHGREELVFRSEQRQLRDIMADKPGRNFASIGRRRSAMEYHSDPVREDDKAFATMLADVLEAHRIAGDFDHLVVVAAPQMLGDIRRVVPEGLHKATVAEIAKDFTKLPVKELREAVANLEFASVPISVR